VTAAARQRRFRERIREGRTVYRAELPAVDTEELLASFGASSLEELIEGLIEIDKAVTHNGTRLATMIRCAIENNPHEV
jgi:predicted component of type VI protein secretion system